MNNRDLNSWKEVKKEWTKKQKFYEDKIVNLVLHGFDNEEELHSDLIHWTLAKGAIQNCDNAIERIENMENFDDFDEDFYGIV